MQPVAAGEDGVHERGAHIEATPAGLEHPLDEVGHLGRRQEGGGELVATTARHEHAARIVDPYLFDAGVIEIGLELAEARDPRDQLVDDDLGLGQRQRGTGEAARVVGSDQLVGQHPHPLGLRLRVDPVRADGGAHPRIERLNGLDVGCSTRFEHAHQQPHPPRKVSDASF